MKLHKIILLFLSVTVIISCSKNDKQNPAKSENNYSMRLVSEKSDTIQGFAVIELFTSEGCSSCPPVEEAFNSVIKKSRETGKNIVAIAEHVDYWNDLVIGEDSCEGAWIDIFSDGFYTQRQFSYTKKLESISATPQAIINGYKKLDVPSAEDLDNVINEELAKDALYGIDLTLNETKSDFGKLEIVVDYKIKISDAVEKRAPMQLNLWLVERNLTTNPNVGENCGSELHHDNIARAFAFKSMRIASEGEITLTCPNFVNIENCTIVGFIHNLKNLDIIGATSGFDFIKK